MSQRTGCLTVTTARHWAEIWLSAGKVVAASSSLSTQTVAHYLLEAGVCSPEQMQNMRAQLHHHVPVAQALQHAGVDLERFAEALQRAVQEIIFKISSYTSGKFALVRRERVDAWENFRLDGVWLALPRGLNAQYLALEMARRRDEARAGLRGRAVGAAGPEAVESPHPTTGTPQGLRLVHELLVEMGLPEHRHHVAQVLLRLATRVFERVALFVVTPTAIAGFAGRLAEPVSDGASPWQEAFTRRVRRLSLAKGRPTLLHEVAAAKALWRGPVPRSAGNQQLLESLGARVATDHEAVCLPLVCAGRVTALVYGDNPSGRPLGDTTLVEILVQHACVLMERALLEHQKWEALPRERP